MAREIITDEKISLLRDVIKEYKGTEGSLMPVLHEGQKYLEHFLLKYKELYLRDFMFH